MLEILLIWSLSKKIAGMASDKGRIAAGYVVMFIGMWFGGEILGAVVGVVISHGEFSVSAYFFALLGAALGAVTAFMIVGLLPSVEDEEDWRPRRRRRRRARDDDDGEERRARSDDWEDESYREKFRPRRARAEEEQGADEDEKSRYRRRRDNDD